MRPAARTWLLGSLLAGGTFLVYVLLSDSSSRSSTLTGAVAQPKAPTVRHGSTATLREVNAAEEVADRASPREGEREVTSQPDTQTTDEPPSSGLTLSARPMRVRAVDPADAPLTGIQFQGWEESTDGAGWATLDVTGSPQLEVEPPWAVADSSWLETAGVGGTSERHLELTLTPATTVDFSVSDRSTTLPLTGVRVRLQTASHARNWTGVTDPQGRVHFDALPSETTLALTAERPGYVTSELTWSAGRAVVPIALEPEIEYVVLRGLVADQEGDPLPGARVECGELTVTSDRRGAFELRVEVGTDLSDLRAYHATGGWCLPTTPEPAPMPHEGGRPVTLTATTGQIELAGVVVEDGERASGVRVEVTSKDGLWSTHAATDRDGTFRLLLAPDATACDVLVRGKDGEHATDWHVGDPPLTVDLRADA